MTKAKPADMVPMMRVSIPMRLQSLANCRLHWRALKKVKEQHRLAVDLALWGKERPPLPAVVTLTRVGKRLLDDDNLAAAFKHCRDQIATRYGVSDGSPLWTWKYDQRVGKEYAVEIQIVGRS